MPREERKKLAEQFSFSEKGLHSQEEIERVLAAFVEPSNPDWSLENFANKLLDLTVGQAERGELDENDLALRESFIKLATDAQEARLFNDTYIGHMLSESSIPGLLGFWLANRIGSNMVAREVSIWESSMEPKAIEFLAADIIGWDERDEKGNLKADGTFTSGGSMAIQTALLVARKKSGEQFAEIMDVFTEKDKIKQTVDGVKRWIDAETGDEIESPRMVVYGTEMTHYSIRKNVGILGPNKMMELREVEHDSSFRMNVDDLEEKIEADIRRGFLPIAVVAVGGETETGKVDPINKIADVSEKFGVPMIVDGAYGTPYRLSRNKDLFKGIDRAFAVIIDPHKTLYTPYSNGAVIFRDGSDVLNVSFDQHDRYLGPGSIIGRKRIEGSGGAGQVLSTLMVKEALGKEGLATLYDLTLDRIEYLYKKVEESKYLANIQEPDLNLLCFAINAETAKRLGIRTDEEMGNFLEYVKQNLDRGIKGNGGYFFSATPVPLTNGKSMWVMRACIMNPRTTDKIIDEAVAGIEQLIEKKL